VRILGIETSCGRGSVALLEDERTIAVATHERENAHGESIQPLIEEVLAQVGWNPTTLDRIAVGTGPGSFTGLRVGIALAQGIAEGLERPLVGVGSLLAMALAAPVDSSRLRCPVLDARRGETFFAVYTPAGIELLGPRVASSVDVLEQAVLSLDPTPLFLGVGCPSLTDGRVAHRSSETDLPHARWTALAAFARAPGAQVVPAYVRHAVVIIPQLPPNPLA
jgi:tRNA threonylcarbamoyladenosine biosynthesis protein TsaB